MRLLKTISKLKSAASPATPSGSGRLAELDTGFDNPGALRGWTFVPHDLPPGAPLVVVLHGCTQNAADYDAGSGWSGLAARHGFALLYPEQTRANNPNGCFNWFGPADTRRGGGEAASIAAMVDAVAAAHAIDRARMFVTGLSAGGAMAAAMLAAYPDMFAAGAIVAGLPHGAASGVPQALEAMAGRGAPADARTLGDRVRAASAHAGPWPRVSVWHGDADMTVAPSNADAIVRQWTDVHGLSLEPARIADASGVRRRTWTDAAGATIVEEVLIAGLGHGTPLRPGTGPGEAGEARAHMLDVGISSTHEIAAFFGVAPAVAVAVQMERPTEPGLRASVAELPRPRPSALRPEPASGPQKVIEDALRAAGLMRLREQQAS